VRALSIVTPVTNTVDGTGAIVTFVNFCLWAWYTSERRRYVNNEIAVLLSKTTSSGAIGPRLIRPFAVDRAGFQFALEILNVTVCISAISTTVLDRDDVNVSIELRTSTATLLVETGRQIGPRCFTVNGAFSFKTLFRSDVFISVLALLTSVSGLLVDGESLVHGANGTGDIAGSKVTP
jgi:hypothetical protein